MGFWSKAAARGITAAGLTNPVPLTQGGTGATSAANARTALGGTTVGQALFIATDAAAARTALEATATGAALLTAATAAAARTTLGGGANKLALTVAVDSLIGSGVYRVVTPVAGTVTKIYSVIDRALTTGNATLTGKIGTTAITNGAITITQAGSAAGDVDSATPSALHTVVAGDVLSVTVGGTNDASGSSATVTFLIEPSA
jgi:hypothetical protein